MIQIPQETLDAMEKSAIYGRIRAVIIAAMTDDENIGLFNDCNPNSIAEFLLENNDLGDATHEQVVAVVEEILANRKGVAEDDEATYAPTLEGIVTAIQCMAGLDPVDVLKMVAMKDRDVATRKAAVYALHDIARLSITHGRPDAEKGDAS